MENPSLITIISEYLRGMHEMLMVNGGMTDDQAIRTIAVSLIVSICAYLLFYAFRAVGICVMSKRKGIKRWWLGALPYFNYHVLGELAGPVRMMGFTAKNVGTFAAIFLFGEHFLVGLQLVAGLVYIYVPSAAMFNLVTYLLYTYLSSILNLVYLCAFVALCLALFGKYAPDKRMLFTFLSLIQPVYSVLLFVLRKRMPYASYDEYYKRKMAERFGQSYDPFTNPYETRNNPFLHEHEGENKDENPFDEY